MNTEARRYIFLGLSITSTWGNGHATTYRGLIKELTNRGHHVTFFERDVSWYGAHREFEHVPYCDVYLYKNLEQLQDQYGELLRDADAVVVGSYVPEGIAVGDWVRAQAKGVVAFYDIDTPVTLAALQAGRCEYLSQDSISKYDLYLSFTGGPMLDLIERRLGSRCARPLYCSVDPAIYFHEKQPFEWDLGYLGTYAPDRQPSLQSLLIDVAKTFPSRRFAVAGPQYPPAIVWPENVTHIEHLAAAAHRAFYNSQHFALNITRRDMIRAGYSPSVRLFEAAACGIPIVTDEWAGLDQFFAPQTEILCVQTSEQVEKVLQMPIDQRNEIAERARCRALRFHTAAVRAAEFDSYITESRNQLASSKRRGATVSNLLAGSLAGN